MPATLDVACPNCGKALKVPAELDGKRVKCKGCDEVFAVRAPKPAAKPAPKPAAAAKPAPKGAAETSDFQRIAAHLETLTDAQLDQLLADFVGSGPGRPSGGEPSKGA